MRAGLALLVAAGHVGADGGPERSGGAEVPAEGVPGQAGMAVSQGGEAGAGEPAPLVSLVGVGLFDPAASAAAAGLVVDAEHLVAVKVGRPLAPAGPFARD